MENIKISITKAGTTNMIIIVSAFVMAAIGIISIQEIGSAYASLQHVRVFIDKGPDNIGDYTIYIKNKNSGNSYTDNRVDGPDNPRNVVYDYNIDAIDGDPIDACIMKFDTSQVTCQTGYASSGFDIDYHLNWNDAIVVNPQQ